MDNIQVKLSDGAVYLFFNKNEIDHTIEIINDIVFADYDKDNKLIGIEVINNWEKPCLVKPQ